MPTFRIYTHQGYRLQGEVTAADRGAASDLARAALAIPTGWTIDACLPGELPDDDPADNYGGIDEAGPGRAAGLARFMTFGRAA